jgi:outer membrane protein assembly factor BamB
VWERRKRVPSVPAPIAKDGRLYLLTNRGELTCVKSAAGEVVWERRIRDSFYASPVWACGRLYCVSRRGIVHVIEADTGKALAAVPLGERSHATPAIARGVMYLRTLSHLMALDGTQRSGRDERQAK